MFAVCDWSNVARLSAIVVVAFGVVSMQAIAQCESKVAAAEKAFYSHDFEGAAGLFDEILDDYSCASKRRTVLLWLARTHDARGRAKDALAYLELLLEEEPPVVELDLDFEPLELVKLFYVARKKKPLPRPDPGLQTIAIVDFENHSIDDRERLEPFRWSLSYFVGKTLAKRTPLKVVERARLQWLLDELHLQRDSSIVDQMMAVRVGKLLGATAVFFGTFMKLGKDVIVTGRVVKVETGEVLLAADVVGKPDDFPKLTLDLSESVAAALDVELEEEGPDEEAESCLTEEAAIAYSTGLMVETEGNVIGALDYYRRAYDAGCTQAKRRIKILEPRLAASD